MYFEVESIQKYPTMNKSVEDLLISSREVMNNVSSTGLENQNTTNVGNNVSENVQEPVTGGTVDRGSPVSSPNLSPRLSPKVRSKRDHSKSAHDPISKEHNNANKVDELHQQDIANKSSDSSQAVKSSHEGKKETRGSERSKKKSSWYNVLYPTYKSRSEDFKRIFKDVPDDERLVVGWCFVFNNVNKTTTTNVPRSDIAETTQASMYDR